MAQSTESPYQTAEPDRVDQAAAESFPASDSPGWTAVHAGAPPRHVAADHGREIRACLRADLDRFLAIQSVARDRRAVPDAVERRRALEEVAASALLESGRAVVRRPIGPSRETPNLETEQRGKALTEPSSVIVVARYDGEEPTGVVMQLAVLRALETERLRRTVCFVMLASEGSQHEAERLRREGTRVHSVISFGHLHLPRQRRPGGVLVLGNLSSGSVARAARDAFESASRIDVRSLSVPSWLPGMGSSENKWFWRQGWSGVTVVDDPPWSVLAGRAWHQLRSSAPDVDGMASAVPGLVAAVVRLAGGRA